MEEDGGRFVVEKYIPDPKTGLCGEEIVEEAEVPLHKHTRDVHTQPVEVLGHRRELLRHEMAEYACVHLTGGPAV